MTDIKLEAWHVSFIRNLFHYSASRLDIEGAFRTKHPFVPKKLYKYRSFNEHSKAALENDQLWFSAPSAFNDPLDSTVYFDSGHFPFEDITLDQALENVEQIRASEASGSRWTPPPVQNPISSRSHLTKMINSLKTEISNEMREALHSVTMQLSDKLNRNMVRDFSAQLRDGLSVLSLSAEPTSTLMWAHYSDSHKGFCIEYDFESLDCDSVHKRHCFPVFYRSKSTNATRYLAKGKNDFNNLFGQYLCLLKGSEWAYEREWRIVHALGQAHANRLVWMPPPSAIILGVDAVGEIVEWTENFCRTRSIPLRRAKLEIGSTKMVIEG